MPYQKYINDEKLNIARGLVRNTSFIHKFGAVPQMSIAATGTVWDLNDTVYPWSIWDGGANTINVPAVNASDDGKTITIEGLDADYHVQSANLVLSSAVQSNTTLEFLRIYRSYITIGTPNIGDINIRNGATTVARISAGKSQTLMATYTVPADITAYVSQGIASIEQGGDCSGDFFVRFGGETSFRTQHTFEVTAQGGPYNYKFDVPVPIPEKSDIDVRVAMRSNNSRVSAAFDAILVGNTNNGAT